MKSSSTAKEIKTSTEELSEGLAYNRELARERYKEKLFKYLCIFAICLPLFILGALLVDLCISGIARIDWDFLTNYPSRKAEKSGILVGIVGSILIVITSLCFALPLGCSCAIYLEEINRKKNSRVARIIEVNINNLAGVPSIIYGIIGLEILVRWLALGRSVLAGGITMGLLVLPIIVVVSRETLKTIPQDIRLASLSLGATNIRTIWSVVLPMALPGILTGSIIAVCRAIGEAAPLIVIGASAYIAFLPSSLLDNFTALPIMIFNWTSRPQAEFHTNAAAGIIVLLAVVLLLNLTAILLRIRLQIRQH